LTFNFNFTFTFTVTFTFTFTFTFTCAAWSGEIGEIAREVVISWAELDQLLLLLLLSSLRRVALLAEAVGIEFDELCRPTAQVHSTRS
jgi:hypothetical protein